MSDLQVSEIFRETLLSLLSPSVWWEVIKIIWPLILVLIIVWLFKFFIEPKVYKKLDKWKRNRKIKKP